MNTRHVRILNIDTGRLPLPITIPDGKECLIRMIGVSYEGETGCLRCKTLYRIADIEKHLGYGKHGWQQFRDRNNTITINNMKFSDCETILSALKGCLVEMKRKQKVVPNKSFSDELGDVLECFLMEQKRCNIISLEETRIALSSVGTPKAVFKKQNVDAVEEVDKAKEANGNQMTEFMDTVHPGNEVADAFNNVFDSAKEITRYGELAREGIQLTNEMSEMRVKIADFTQKLKAKELAFKQNQRDVLEMKKTLKNNPLLKFEETTKQVNDSDELKKKIERLEAENQSLKEEKQTLEDRLGEGENYRTARNFPDKFAYFIKSHDLNLHIGKALTGISKMYGFAYKKNGVREGANDVNVYDIKAFDKLLEWIKTKIDNVIMRDLQDDLKPEWRLNQSQYSRL